MIGERDVTDLDPKDRGLAMVFQSYALYPTKTVRGNLRFGLVGSEAARGRDRPRIAWAAKLLQIEPLLDRKPAQLSGGQRQRVAIGRALVKHVERASCSTNRCRNLDAKLRTEMRLEIKKLHDELKPTIVYVTHDQIEAMTMATKIAVMNGGVIQQFGTPDEIYERPANLFVAGFIGSPAMNLQAARRSSGARRHRSAPNGDGDPLDLRRLSVRRAPAGWRAEVIVGLRPEHFGAPGAARAGAAATFDLPVPHTERTGSDATGYLRFGDGLLAAPRRARAQPPASKPGQTSLGRLPQRQGQPLRRPHRAAALDRPQLKGGYESMTRKDLKSGLWPRSWPAPPRPARWPRTVDHLPQLVRRARKSPRSTC